MRDEEDEDAKTYYFYMYRSIAVCSYQAMTGYIYIESANFLYIF